MRKKNFNRVPAIERVDSEEPKLSFIFENLIPHPFALSIGK